MVVGSVRQLVAVGVAPEWALCTLAQAEELVWERLMRLEKRLGLDDLSMRIVWRLKARVTMVQASVLEEEQSSVGCNAILLAVAATSMVAVQVYTEESVGCRT
jgi:hypothetical protein